MNSATENQKNIDIPTWDQLVQHSLEKIEPKQLAKISQLKTHKKPLMMNIGRKIVHGLFKDPAIHKFADISWQDLVEVLAAQMSENRSLRESFGYKAQELKPYLHRSEFQVDRSFSQLPCTKVTVQKRVEKALELCEKDDPLLLLGDDDFISLGLAEAGFQNITVLDIDSQVLKVINQANVGIRTLRQDLCKPLPESFPDNFKMVFFDPFYSLKGIEIFLNAACRLTKTNPDPIFFLSVHLMSLLREGLRELQPILDQFHVKLAECMPNFNSYPVPLPIKLLVKLVNKTVIRDRTVQTEGSSFRFFTSDALILKRKIGHQY